MTRILTALSLALLMAFTAQADRRPYMIDSIQTRLAAFTTATDSLKAYLDILDLSAADPDARVKISKKVYETAARACDTVTMIESLTYRANAAMNDSVELKSVKAQLKDLSPSPRRLEAELFADMLLARNRIKYNEDSSREELSRIMQQSLLTADGDYPRLLSLYSVCVALSSHTTGPLLEDYFERLIQLVDGMNLPMGSVRNLVYNSAALVYAGNRNSTKAVEMNKKLLNIVDSLTESYARRGRMYRRLDRNRYLFYRRMLINHDALSSAEVESYHRAIHILAKENKDIREDIGYNPLAHACYLVANGKYEEAIAAFKKASGLKENAPFLYCIYSNIFEAAEKSGNRPEQLAASVQLNNLLQSQIKDKTEERYRELQIMYDVNDLKARTLESEEEGRLVRIRASRLVVGIAIAGFVLLVLFVFVLLSRNRKMRKLSKELKSAADRLREERNELRGTQNELIQARDMAKSAERAKTEFIDNISHEIKTPLSAVAEYSRLIVDCIPEDQNRYLKKFADIIDLNTRLVLTLIDDLLDASSLEHGNMGISIAGVSVHKLCTVAIGSVFENMSAGTPDVKLIFNPSDKADIVINTDSKRVVQILMNLLSNASKFTERGKIIVDYDCDTATRKITFSVTDTGCGIPQGREEDIFVRFNRSNSNTPGVGLGLYISRLLARLLNGDLVVDPSYREGARFLLVIPM